MAKLPKPPKEILQDAQTDALKRYRAKRRFDETAEPDGSARPTTPHGAGPIFVVQKHAATRLHYDLRLEVNGALASWAVPQGPSLDPRVRRFAAQTEDHPLDYANFEGRIRAGNYGAGDVIIWDRGTYVTLEENPKAAIAAGEIKFRLAGEKLKGGFMLKRLAGDDPKAWLLIKERDVEARPTAEFDVLSLDASVVTGRAVGPRREPETPRPSSNIPPPDPSRIKGAKAAAMPVSVKPQLCEPVPSPPNGPGWLHEVKYDGYRTLVFLTAEGARLITRNGLDWSARYGALTRALAKVPAEAAVIDGEVVVQDPRGVASLHLLEDALSAGRTHDLTFFAFDLLHLNGFDLTGASLADRKNALQALIDPVSGGKSAIQFSEHIEGDGEALFAQAMRMGIEGVVSKRAEAKYIQGRSSSWVKAKHVDDALFCVIGFTTNAPRCVAALILGETQADGLLAYIGKAGSGIGGEKSRALYNLLSPHEIRKPVVKVPKIADAHWMEPSFEARIAFRGRSATGVPRQPVVIGMPEQKAAPAAPAEPIKARLVSDRDLASVRLTNPEREMFEGSGVTKLDIALYYARVGDWMLPELAGRPVSLIRCPSGALKDCFYQRHAFAGLPPGIDRVELAAEGEERAAYIAVANAQGFLALAQFGAIEFHPWGCQAADPECPDRLVFDLDPSPELSWRQVCDGADALRERLEALGLTPFLRTTGGKGLHLVCALAPKQDWAVVKGFAEAVAKAAAADAPGIFTNNMSKQKRVGRIFVDYLRNGRGATAIASYSLRARLGFPVATPIAWQEARNLPGGDAFDRKSVLKRLETLSADPWDALNSMATPITLRMRRDVGMKA